jgi:hypothetical protein
MVAALCLSAATLVAQRGKQQSRPADAQRPQQGVLKVGDLAPDFTLAPRDGGAPVSLASFRGRLPVALVFGSFT